MKQQSGFATVELVIVAVILAAVSVTGYYVWQNHNIPTQTASSTQPAATTSSPSVATLPAPQITTASSLNSAMQVLNQTSVSSSNTDSTQLSTQSQSF